MITTPVPGFETETAITVALSHSFTQPEVMRYSGSDDMPVETPLSAGARVLLADSILAQRATHVDRICRMMGGV